MDAQGAAIYTQGILLQVKIELEGMIAENQMRALSGKYKKEQMKKVYSFIWAHETK